MFDFVSKRKWFFLGSGLLIVAGIIALIAAGLNVGLDFRPGVTMTLVFQQPVEQEELRSAFGDAGYSGAVIQHSPKEAFLVEGLDREDQQEVVDDLQARFDTTIRLVEFDSAGDGGGLALIIGKPVSQDQLSSELAELGYSGVSVELTTLDSYLVRIGEREAQESDGAGDSLSSQQQIERELESTFGPVDFLDFDSISATVASERVQYTGYAVAVAAVAIVLYIAWSFRKLANSFRFGFCAILALLHDVLIVLAVFAILRIEVNSMFIIAILTVIGYGVNNIIVVFDRIRENRGKHLTATYDAMVNVSITETLTRSLNTSLTTIFVLLALFLFGGATIHNFVLALIVGVISATYSSLFIAPQLLVSWEWGELGRLFRWIPFRLPHRG